MNQTNSHRFEVGQPGRGVKVEKRTVPGRVCCWCGRFLPATYFPMKNKVARYKVCRDCKKTGHSCMRPEPKPKPKRKEMTPEERQQWRREYQREYHRKYREEHRDDIRKITRESIARKRAGEPKRKPGPPKGVTFNKTEHIIPVQVQERLCETSCKNWPCFRGINNLESDFAREGCHGYDPREDT